MKAWRDYFKNQNPGSLFPFQCLFDMASVPLISEFHGHGTLCLKLPTKRFI